MFVRSASHHRPLRKLVIISSAAIAMLLTACAPGQAQPTDYGVEGELFYTNFMIGCTDEEPQDGSFEHVDAEKFAFCECVFRGMKDRVPFADAMSAEESLADIDDNEEFEVPQRVLTVMDSCDNDTPNSDDSAGDTNSDDATEDSPEANADDNAEESDANNQEN